MKLLTRFKYDLRVKYDLETHETFVLVLLKLKPHLWHGNKKAVSPFYHKNIFDRKWI